METRWLERAPTHAAWTLVTWYVIEGREGEFIEAWRVLGAALAMLSQAPFWGVLLQNHHDPRAFSSFGPWRSLQDIEIMRKDASVQEAFQRLVDCCHEAASGTFRLAGHIDARSLQTADRRGSTAQGLRGSAIDDAEPCVEPNTPLNP